MIRDILNQPARTRLLLGTVLLPIFLAIGYQADRLSSQPRSQHRLAIFFWQLIAIGIVGVIFRYVRGGSSNAIRSTFAGLQADDQYTTLGLVVGLSVLGLAANQFDPVTGKWAILIFLFLCFPGIPLIARCADRRQMPAGIQAFKYLATAIACALPIIIVIDLWDVLFQLDSAVLAILLLIALLPIVTHPPQIGFRASAPRSQAISFSFLIFVVCFTAICAMRSLQNLEHILGNFERLPISTAFVAAFFACLAVELCLQIGLGRDRQAPNQGTRSALSYLLRGLPYAVILMFALRADSLFYKGPDMPDMHWDYFIGPVQTVRSGGWLLWDTPSQYGFLNILLTALIPFRSAWDSFYFFQAATLFAAAGLFYRFLHHYSHAGRLISLALVITSFFLAYPTLIGPAPFPSSSAVRFLWCYALLYFSASIFLKPAPSMRTFVRRGTFLWLAAVLWSAESAIYATPIFFAPVLLYFLLRFLSEGHSILTERESWNLVTFPLAILALTLLGISTIYYLAIGHVPDFEMFWMYGSGYAAGFGGIPMNWDGPIWIFALVFLVASAGLRAVLTDHFSAEGPAGIIIAVMACIWATASYYIGRAVPNNVVALFPLICFALAITLRSIASSARISPAAIAVALPIFSLAMATPIWNEKVFSVIRGLRPYPQSMESRLPAPDSSLTALMARAQIDVNSPVVYYSNSSVMPVDIANGTTHSRETRWLPTPLTLLEEPVPLYRQSIILERFFQRHPKSGYFIHRSGERDAGAKNWIMLLSRMLVAQTVYNNDEYEIILFKDKRLP
jgi:hypothetical protein